MPDAAHKVVLTALCHGDRPGGELLFADIFGHSALDLLPQRTPNAAFIVKNLAVDRFGKSVFRCVKPLAEILRRAGKAQMPLKIIFDNDHAMLQTAVTALGTVGIIRRKLLA